MPRSGRIRTEGNADLRVIEVVSVAEDDRRALRRRQFVGKVLQLGERRTAVLGGELGQLGIGSRATVLVDRDAACDRERPGAEMLAVAQARIRTQRTEKRLLESILGAFASEPTHEERVDLLAMFLVKALERRQVHVVIF